MSIYILCVWWGEGGGHEDPEGKVLISGHKGVWPITDLNFGLRKWGGREMRGSSRRDAEEPGGTGEVVPMAPGAEYLPRGPCALPGGGGRGTLGGLPVSLFLKEPITPAG